MVHCDKEELDKELLRELRLEEMVKRVLCMLDTAKRALNEESVELAVSVFGKDNLLDEIQQCVDYLFGGT